MRKENRSASAAGLCTMLCAVLGMALSSGSCSFLPEISLDELLGGAQETGYEQTTAAPETSAAPKTSAPVTTTTAQSTTTTQSTTAAPSFTASDETSYTESDESFWFDYKDLYGRNTPHSSRSTYASLFSDKLGSGGDLRGTTVILSIFADDETSGWDFTDSYDRKAYDTIRENLDIACSFITESAKSYGVDASFIYDFEKNEDLVCYNRFDFDFEADIDESSCDDVVWEYIEDNIDTKALLKKYRAQNIVYLLYINNSPDCEVVSCTRSNYSGMEYPYEICFFFMYDGYDLETPAVFAHEILHTFGAPDLYCVDDQYGITQEYVEYAEEEFTNDIMRDCYDIYYGTRYYHSISNEITDITAYYIGWKENSDEVEMFDLGETEHVIN